MAVSSTESGQLYMDSDILTGWRSSILRHQGQIQPMKSSSGSSGQGAMDATCLNCTVTKKSQAQGRQESFVSCSQGTSTEQAACSKAEPPEPDPDSSHRHHL